MERKTRVFGEAIVSLKDLVEHARKQELMYSLFEEGKTSKSAIVGQVILRNCSLRKFYTFLDLHVKNELNIVPIFAVDYSMANLTF